MPNISLFDKRKKILQYYLLEEKLRSQRLVFNFKISEKEQQVSYYSEKLKRSNFFTRWYYKKKLQENKSSLSLEEKKANKCINKAIELKSLACPEVFEIDMKIEAFKEKYPNGSVQPLEVHQQREALMFEKISALTRNQMESLGVSDSMEDLGKKSNIYERCTSLYQDTFSHEYWLNSNGSFDPLDFDTVSGKVVIENNIRLFGGTKYAELGNTIASIERMKNTIEQKIERIDKGVVNEVINRHVSPITNQQQITNLSRTLVTTKEKEANLRREIESGIVNDDWFVLMPNGTIQPKNQQLAIDEDFIELDDEEHLNPSVDEEWTSDTLEILSNLRSVTGMNDSIEQTQTDNLENLALLLNSPSNIVLESSNNDEITLNDKEQITDDSFIAVLNELNDEESSITAVLDENVIAHESEESSVSDLNVVDEEFKEATLESFPILPVQESEEKNTFSADAEPNYDAFSETWKSLQLDETEQTTTNEPNEEEVLSEEAKERIEWENYRKTKTFLQPL